MCKSTIQLSKYVFLAWFGGSCYVTLEVLWRGYSHWTMFLLGAFLFVVIDLLNEVWPNWKLLPQAVVGAGIVTLAELVVGCIVNLWLKWDVWDYSNVPCNLLGQICPQFSFLWVFMSVLAIIVADVIRWKFFGEEKPRYTIV